MGTSNEKFEYFIERTEKDLEHIRSRVDKLWEFRFLLLGGSAVVSVLVAVLFNTVMLYLRAK